MTADARLDLLAQDAALAAQAVDPATSDADPVATVPQASPQTAPADGLERVMLADDKLPVVLAVVLIVWAGILLLLWRTERRLTQLERRLPADTAYSGTRTADS